MPKISKKHLLFSLTVFFISLFLFLPFFSLTESDSNFQYLFPTSFPESKTIEVKKLEPADNVLVFGGDIMLSRTVNSKMEKYNDYSWPFSKINGLFKEADLAIANLESPFLKDANYQVLTGSFSFKANPKSVTGLVTSGFDVLSLSNNHILNQGKKGLKDTKDILRENSIEYTGLVEQNLIVRESKGVKFAFLSYTYNNESSLVANMDSLELLKEDIVRARQKADVVIVMMHAGVEYVREPNKQQVSFAHTAIDYGADLVVGHHPHWPQIIEEYQGKNIIYSLGNLVFDQMWSKETASGLTAKIFFKGTQITRIEYIPIIISDYGQAQLMPEGEQKQQLLKSIKAI
jgi:poly-gamma-glutamate synthesis protein (capsule biosynthesis protein)